MLSRPDDATAVLTRVVDELRARVAGGSGVVDAPARFLFIRDLQNFRTLRQEDEFAFGSSDAGVAPGALLKELVTEGPAHGLHTLVTCDTYNSVTRFLGRKTLSEFGLRVLFEMSPNDSASLIDNPAAGRLGLHRALLHQEREGMLEIFRPCALLDADWLDTAALALARRAAS